MTLLFILHILALMSVIVYMIFQVKMLNSAAGHKLLRISL